AAPHKQGKAESSGRGAGASAAPSAAVPKPVSSAPQRRSLSDSLSGVAQRARQNKEKIRVEGFALGGDKDRVGESLKRANLVRDRLLQNGLTPEQIEVVATGQSAQGEAVRISALAGEN